MIKRKLLESLRGHLGSREISLIVGPRQAGKTTLMKMLEEELRNQGRLTVSLSLDLDKDKPFFNSQQELVNKIRLELGNEGGVVFLDEIQRKTDAGLFLKGLFDLIGELAGVKSDINSLNPPEK